MSDDLLPEYDYALETTLHLRCTVCGYWWNVEGGDPSRAYHCPACGVRLSPAQYPNAKPPARKAAKEVPL